MKTVFDTAMVAHIWAQGRQEEGRNPARRVFFEGPRLYSYGLHFLTAYRLPDGAAFLNSARYSVSTSRHQHDARHAIRGRGYAMPGELVGSVAAFLESSVFRVPDYAAADQWAKHGEGRPPAEYREATPAEQKEARPRLLKLFLDAKETAPAESIVAAFRYAGAEPEEAAKAAAKVTAAHAKRAKEEAAAALKRDKEDKARDARAAAARPLSDFAAAVETARADLKRSNYRGARERAAAELLDSAKRLFRARKEAKARGWTRLCADLKARESVLRQGAAGLEAYSARCFRVAHWAEQKAAIRRGLGLLNGPARDAYGWMTDRQAAEFLLKAIRGAALYPQGDESESLSADLARAARLMGASLPDMAAGLESIVAAFHGAEEQARQGAAREARRAQVAALRAFLAAPEDASLKVAEAAERAARPLARVAGFVPYGGGAEVGGYTPKIPGPFALAGFTADHFRAIRDAAKARANVAKAQEQAAALEAWREGKGVLPYRASDAEGGAMLRARGVERDAAGAITGGTLETSHGASVPLAHALRAFRFLKLCRDNGREWRANGKTLPVGHFRIDLVDSTGGFRAGCHRINWGEVAALAARLGVDSLAPADTTEARAPAYA